MGRRDDLHAILVDLMKDLGEHVYFDPPIGFKIAYPCIVYALSDIDTWFADNRSYLLHRRYTITLIDTDPDNNVVDRILELNRCSFDRHFISDNLHHWVFNIYY